MIAMMPVMQKYLESVKQRVNNEFAKALQESEEYETDSKRKLA